MSDPLPSEMSQALVHSIHPALSGANSSPIDWPMQTVLACPLPLSTVAAEYLLPELSHEIKTPLSGIMGLAQIIQQQAGAIAAHQHQYADLIYQKSQQLLTAINDLLDLTQIGTRQFVLHLQPVELGATVKVALQTAQRSTGLNLNCTLMAGGADDTTEHWIIADPARLEQLLTHLINTLLLQSPAVRCTELSFHPNGNWMAITFTITPLRLSENELVYLGWPYQPSSAQVSALPNRNDVVLKSLLARQLTQLHGGDIAWTSDAVSTTSVTIFLPQDLTRTTHQAQLRPPSHLVLIVSQRTTEIHGEIQALIGQGELVLMARSLPEATEKLQILSPSILAIDSQFAQVCGWNTIQTWLDEQIDRNRFTLLWLGDTSSAPDSNDLESSNRWPWPLTAQDTLRALQQFPTTTERSLPLTTQVSPSLASFTVLQLGSMSAISAPESLALRLLTQLSQDHGCSILAVDNADQAGLLARIWKPKIMICLGPIPTWVETLSKTSRLLDLPCVLLRPMTHSQNVHTLGKLNLKTYTIPKSLQTQPIQIIANHLYAYMTHLISDGYENS